MDVAFNLPLDLDSFVSRFSEYLCFQGSITLWHVSAFHSFLWLNSQLYNIPQCVHPLSVDGHLGGSCFLMIINNAAILVHFSGCLQSGDISETFQSEEGGLL